MNDERTNMKITYKTDKVYRFRRYAAGMKVLAASWLFISAMIFLAGPRWLSFAAAVLSAIVGCFPALLLAASLDEIAERSLRGTK